MNLTHAPMMVDRRRQGIVAVLAMLFLVIFSSLAAAMAIVTQGNMRSADSYAGMNRSLAAAETGMQYFTYRVEQVADTIFTAKGDIDESEADTIWPDLRDGIIDELGDELHSLESYTLEGDRITLGRVPVGVGDNAPTFQVIVERHPMQGEDYDAPLYQRAPYNLSGGENRFTSDGEPVSSLNPVASFWVRVRVRGEDGPYHRDVQMDFRIDKRVKFAILSRNRIMIGRNVIIRGAIGSKYTLVNYENGHPVQVRDNFTNLDAQLDGWLNSFENYLAANDLDGDNRIWITDTRESGNLANPNNYDRNGDGYVEAYDLFLLKYDTNADGALSESEFSDGSGVKHDEQLWRLINEVKYPPGTEFDWPNKQYRPRGGAWTDGSADMSTISNDDLYSKLSGRVTLAVIKSDWEAGASDGPYQHFLEDSIRPDVNEVPILFEAPDSELADFPPDAFDVSGYRAMATGNFATQAAAAVKNDPLLPATYTDPSPATVESVPFNSPYPYDYYARPVYENMVFNNVMIPKGTNALFKNCKFIGVTFVDTETDDNHENFNYAGMQNPDGSVKYVNIQATVNGTQVSDTKPLANSIRFHDCKFEGVVVTEASDAYAHVRNKLQFTGRTNFDIEAPGLTAEQKALFRRSTIMAPQFSLDMGSFDTPNNPNEVVTLDGTIVAGVFDVRGQATVDGSLITTYDPTPSEGPLFYGGNPAAFNTTIGYFESDAGDTEGEIPPGGYGKIIIRYDPNRSMPDGIIGSIDFGPEYGTYFEGG